MSKLRSRIVTKNTKQVACTISAAALMLGVSEAATVGLHFQENYCGSAAYSGFPVTLTAFGIAPGGWENLIPMDTGYSGCTSPLQIYTLSETISTTTSDNGLNPLPNGTLNIVWTGNGANFSGFAGYGGSPPSYAYDGHPPSNFPTGEWEVYSTFIRDGVNFGIDPSGSPSYTHCGDNTQPSYTVDITGLKSVFTNSQFVVELIAAADSMQTLTNAFIVDKTTLTTNSVTYPNTPSPYDEGGTCSQWLRGHGGGLSTVSPPLNTDHVFITSNHPQHGGVGAAPTGYNRAGTISGFIITDKPLVTMSPQPVLAGPGDAITLNPYAIGVPPLSYQWRLNGHAVAGATNSAYTIASLSAGLAGNYDLVVTNIYGSTTSAVSVVTEDMISLNPGTNFVADDNPVNALRVGINRGAIWQATNSDGTTTRTGVVQFVGTNADLITVSGTTNFDVPLATITFWMRSGGTDPNAPGSLGAAVFGRPSSKNGSDFMISQLDGGNIYFNAPASGGASAVNITSSAMVSDDKWHLIALTFDQSANGGATLYVDGVLDTTNANTQAWPSPTGKAIEIGSSSDTFWRSYDGLLDDVRFYSRQLTAAEITSIFTSGDLVDPANLQMQLNFDAAPGWGFSLSWQLNSAILQSSSNLLGPYTDVPAAVAPYNLTTRPGQKYYRYRFINQTLVSNPYLM